LLNFALRGWGTGVTPSASTTAADASTAAGYILIGCIFVFGRALAPFAFFIFGGHRSYF
jgi:hypothetical protein